MTSKPQAPLALVIGATGGIGGAVAARLLAGGWRVRALHRDPEAARRNSGRGGLEWVKGDAMVEGDVVAAARGAQLIVHGANPPGYRNWAGLAVPMLANSVAAAKATGARILFPGNVYNFGPDAWPVTAENAPQTPLTRKGRIRARMETALAQSGAKVLIVRAGDFFGPTPGGNWLAQGLVKAGRPIAAVTYPGPLDRPHAWAWLPDLAESMVRLAERDDLAQVEVFHHRGHVLTGAELIAALQAVAGRGLAVQKFPWFALAALAPFNEMFREMLEMRYLWDEALALDNRRLIAKLGAEPHTPIEAALRAALHGLDALPRQPESLAA
jgi:nucleoside-diphosphate-sugar epimerase